MKRLNRKGFTLVELLAVIVILAIVVGITMVTVLPTLKKSRQEAFEISAQTVADYLEKQYQLYMIGESTTVPFTPGSSFSGLVKTATDGKFDVVNMTADQLTAAGVKTANYVAASWYIDSNTGRACVSLTASTNTSESAKVTNMSGTTAAGEFYDATEGNQKITIDGKEFLPSVAKSTGCN